MLVKEALAVYIQSRPLRASTKTTYERTFKVLDLLEADTKDLTVDLLYAKLNEIPNHNTRRTHTIVLRSVLGDIPGIKLLKVQATQPKYWDLPDENTLRTAIEQSRWWKVLYLCMYAGLRVGEACAVRPSDLRGNRLIINRQITQQGELLPAKTVGQVILPQWLAEFVANMDETDWWPEGKTSKRLTDHCKKLSKKTKVKVTPHLLRHWYATEMIRATRNPELVRRQLRHARLDTTLQVYAQVSHEDLNDLVDTVFPG